jgi:hypothetical protein
MTGGTTSTRPEIRIPYRPAATRSLLDGDCYPLRIRSHERMDAVTGRGLWRELPRLVRILLGALFVAALANIVTNLSGGPVDLGPRQAFTAIAVWIGGGAAAFAYAYERYLGRDQPLAPSRVSLRRAMIVALSSALVLALVDLFVAR